MRLNRALPAALALTFAAPALPAAAQVRVEVVVPRIHFEAAPRLVVVAPGVQVVPDYDHEVFFSGGWYWTWNDGHWFRAKTWRHPRWVRVKHRAVPAHVRGVPRGRYLHYRPARHDVREHRRDVRERRQDVREHRRGHRKDVREDRRERRKDRREDRREDRKDRRKDRRGHHEDRRGRGHR